MKTIRRVNFTFLLTVVIALVASYLFRYVTVVREYPIVNILVSQAIYVIPVLVYLITSKESTRELLRIKRVKLLNVFLLIAFAFFIAPLLSFLNAISLLFTTNQISNIVSNIVVSYPLPIALFVVAGIPAILEETVYRGVFFNEYRKVNPRKGVVLSGLLFGLMHMNFNQFIYAFAMGMIFALVVEVTDSIVSSMIIHFTINGSTVMLTYILPKLQNMVAGSVSDDTIMNGTLDATAALSTNVLLPAIIFWGIVAIFTTTVAFVILNGISKVANRPDALRNLFTQKFEYKMDKIESLPLIFGIIICLGIMIYQQCILY